MVVGISCQGPFVPHRSNIAILIYDSGQGIQMKKIREPFVFYNPILNLTKDPAFTSPLRAFRWEPEGNVAGCHRILKNFWKDIGPDDQDHAVGTVFRASEKFVGMRQYCFSINPTNDILYPTFPVFLEREKVFFQRTFSERNPPKKKHKDSVCTHLS